MLSSLQLKQIVAEARPIIERQLDDAELIAGIRDMVASHGGDWSALKLLLKAQIQDERDEAGGDKRVRKVLDKAEFATAYADMLGLANMNEQNFSENTETVVSHSSPSNGQPGGMVPPPAVPPGAHSNPDARTDSKTPSQSRRENSRYESASERGRAHLELENGNTIRNHQTPPANLSSEVAI